MMYDDPVISRHRLRQPYRLLLVGLWLLPILVFTVGLLIGHGATLKVFDPRLLLPLLLMAFPALYVWQEGIDAHVGGITARMYVPRYYAFDDLAGWRIENHRAGHILTVWNKQQRRVIAYHAAHLTRLPQLLAQLEAHLDRPHPEDD
jgi:hypothetical protein